MKLLLATLIAVFTFGFMQASYAAEAEFDRQGWKQLTREERHARRAERREKIRERRLNRRDRRVSSVPELDGGYALMALGLVGGIALVVRERRRRRV